MENMPLEYSVSDARDMTLYREIWRAIDPQPEIADCGAVTGPDHWLTLAGRVVFNSCSGPCPFNLASPYCAPGDVIWYSDELFRATDISVILKKGIWYWVIKLDKLVEV